MYSVRSKCTQTQQHDGVPGIRRILGVLALAKKHGPAVVEDAAKAALEIGLNSAVAIELTIAQEAGCPPE